MLKQTIEAGGLNSILAMQTQGKRTTASILWIFHQAGIYPFFIIGRIPQNFNPRWSMGTPMKICVLYPVDVCYVIFYTKKSRVNQNLDSDCPCPLVSCMPRSADRHCYVLCKCGAGLAGGTWQSCGLSTCFEIASLRSQWQCWVVAVHGYEFRMGKIIEF